MGSFFDNGGVIGIGKDLADTNSYIQYNGNKIEFVGISHASTNDTNDLVLSLPAGTRNTDNILLHLVYEADTANRPNILGFSVINSRNGTYGAAVSTQVLLYGQNIDSTITISNNVDFRNYTTAGNGLVASAVVLRNVSTITSNFLSHAATTANVNYTASLSDGDAFIVLVGVDGASTEVFTTWSSNSNFDYGLAFVSANGANNGRAAFAGVDLGPVTSLPYTSGNPGTGTGGSLLAANVFANGTFSGTTLSQKSGGIWSLNAHYQNRLLDPYGAIANVEFLLIAGGGAGGSGYGGGGGGAGGYIEAALPLLEETAYTVTIGAGGTGVNSLGISGSNGSNSIFSSNVAYGGGGGGAAFVYARSGGSGGGGRDLPDASAPGGAGFSGQGYQGGNGYLQAGSGTGGGGGGAGAVGGSATISTAGNGGDGLSSTITGSSVTRAGGGGGGCESSADTQGSGGAGGGGAGTDTATTAGSGTVNSGSGGGGSGGTQALSGSGGSGIIILRIPERYTANFTVGVAQTVSFITVGDSNYKVYTITAAGASDNVMFRMA